MTEPHALVQSFNSMDADTRKQVAADLATSNPGLFDLDKRTRREIWIGFFVLLTVLAVGALVIIYHSYDIDVSTTTGSGATKVTAVTHPDVSAAWAAVTAIITGIVGVFVPSPASK